MAEYAESESDLEFRVSKLEEAVDDLQTGMKKLQDLIGRLQVDQHPPGVEDYLYEGSAQPISTSHLQRVFSQILWPQKSSPKG